MNEIKVSDIPMGGYFLGTFAKGYTVCRRIELHFELPSYESYNKQVGGPFVPSRDHIFAIDCDGEVHAFHPSNTVQPINPSTQVFNEYGAMKDPFTEAVETEVNRLFSRYMDRLRALGVSPVVIRAVSAYFQWGIASYGSEAILNYALKKRKAERNDQTRTNPSQAETTLE